MKPTSTLESQYLEIGQRILEQKYSGDRTGVGTQRLFGAQVRADLREGFPLITTKKVAYDKVFKELCWFLKGGTHLDGLGNARNLWEPWAREDGSLGPIYGAQWARQLPNVMYEAATHPDSRRLIVNCWQLDSLDEMALPPCHVMFQLFCDGEYLDLMWTQRSADWAIGVPFNIASYAALTHILAHHLCLKPRNLIGSFGDCHVYSNHREGFQQQVGRLLRPMPTLEVSHCSQLWGYESEDFKVTGYDPHPPIKYKVAV